MPRRSRAPSSASRRGVFPAPRAAVALALAAALVFAGIALAVRRGASQPVDEAVLRWFGAHHTPLLDTVALQLTYLGASSVVALTLVVSSALLGVTGHRGSAVLLWVAVLGNAALNTLLKRAFARPRPEVFPFRIPGIGDAAVSFPSGHAMSAVVAYGTLAFVVARLQPSGLRLATLAFAALLVLSVGASRLYLGVHYPSDVAGGFAAGFAWAVACAGALGAVRPRPGTIDKD